MTRWGFSAILIALAAGNLGLAIVRREPAVAVLGLLAAFLAMEELARLSAASPGVLRTAGLLGGGATLALWVLGRWGITETGVAHLALAAGYVVEAVRLGRPHAPSPSE